MAELSAEPLRNLMIRLIQAHDEEGLTAEGAAELMINTINSNSCYSGPCGSNCPGFGSFLCLADPNKGEGSWKIPKIPPRYELIDEILDLQRSGFRKFREYYVEIPEAEAENFTPLLLQICESWNKVSHSVMKKLETGYREKESVFLSLKEARQFEDLTESLADVLEEANYTGEWRWRVIEEDLIGQEAAAQRCYMPYYGGTVEFWKTFLSQAGAGRYEETEASFIFDKEYEERLQEDIVSKQEMETISYLELMGIREIWRWHTYTEWNEEAQIHGQAAAEFMILLTTIEDAGYSLFLEEDSEDDDSDQPVKTEERPPVMTFCEEEAARKYSALAQIFTAFQDFHVRTSGRWREVLDLEDKDLRWPCIRPRE